MRHLRDITKLAIIATFSLLVIVAPIVRADDFNSANDIYYYDKNAVDCSAGSSATTPLSGSANMPKIWNWLIAQGMSENGAAGIMGNMSPESGFNPFRIQGGAPLRTYAAMVSSSESNSAFGLVQWDGAR